MKTKTNIQIEKKDSTLSISWDTEDKVDYDYSINKDVSEALKSLACVAPMPLTKDTVYELIVIWRERAANL